MKHQRLLLPSYICILLLLTLTPRLTRAAVALRAAGKDLYISENDAQYLLLHNGQWMIGQAPQRVPYAGGYSLLLSDDNLQAWHGQDMLGQLSYDDVITAWLADEARWPNQQEMNALRAAHRLGKIAGEHGGIDGCFTDVLPTSAGVLAIFSWYDMRPSLPALLAQFLVRITVEPAPGITELQRLECPPGAFRFPGAMAPHLLAVDQQIFLLAKPGAAAGAEATSTLETLSPQGNSTGVFCHLPATLTLYGGIDNRWLLFGDDQGNTAPGDYWARPMQILDLRTKQLTALPAPWKNAADISRRLFFPASGNRFLFTDLLPETTPEHGRAYSYATYVVTLPKGQAVKIDTPNAPTELALWDNYVIAYTTDGQRHYTIDLYDARNGRKVTERRE